MFHEFGHGLHQLLTRVDVPGVSGIQGVEWDAVELPSQFMENFCWEWDVLRAHDARTSTPATPLPRDALRPMLAAKNFQSGMATRAPARVRAVRHAAARRLRPGGAQPWPTPQALLDAVRARGRRRPAAAPTTASSQSFAHVFAGGYAAGYYSYKWAEVLSADAFSLFEEQGVLSPAVGARFRDEVLARGGSRPALESFVAFRGRPPQLDALLRHNGMTLSS